MNYEPGKVDHFNDWIGKFANCQFDYFGRHKSGRPVNYSFNSLGYRGPEHWDSPDISIFGSSFSFGIGIDYNQCWHQLLGDYRVNCYAPAGFLVTNNDIINHYNMVKPKGRVILQFREFKYNTDVLTIPSGVDYFIIDEQVASGHPGFSYSSFLDRAEDDTHPGPNTHILWAKILKRAYKL